MGGLLRKIVALLVLVNGICCDRNSTTKPQIQSRAFDSPAQWGNMLNPGSYADPWASPVPASMQSVPETCPGQMLAPTSASVVGKAAAPAKALYKLSVICGIDDMKVNLEFEKPFPGIVYSKGYFNKPSCIYVTGRENQRIFNFTIGYEKCGSFTRQAQAPVIAATAKPRSVDSTTQTPSTTHRPTSAIPEQPSREQNARKIDSIDVDKDFEEWFQRRFGTSTTTTIAPYIQSPNSVPASALMQPQPVTTYPMNYVQNPLAVGHPAAQMRYGNAGVAIPQNLLPSSLSGYSYPLQQQQMMGAQYPQYQTAYGQPMGAYPYYQRMGRAMEADVPAEGLQWVENTIVIQQDREVQDVLDEAKSLQCEWRNSYSKKSVSNTYHVDLADVVRASFPGDSVGAYMQIRSGLGPLAAEAKGVVKIGSPLTLVIALTDSDNKFDLFVHSCTAKGDGKAAPWQLVDANGCVVRDKYMGPFVPFYDANSTYGDNRVTFAYFQAFKFPDSADVNIDCSVTICRNSCPRQCFGKYAGDAETLLKTWNRSENGRSLNSEKIFRPPGMDGTREQRKIISALEKRLSAVNGPQRFEVNVNAKTPVGDSPTRFLQLRELDDETTKNSTKPHNKTVHIVSSKAKREIDSMNSSNVDLRKKLTVITPKEMEPVDGGFVLPTNFPDDISPRQIAIPTPITVQPTILSTAHPAAVAAALVGVTPAPVSSAATFPTTTPVPGEKITVAPWAYMLPNDAQHVCVPLVGVVVGGALALVILLIALICSCCLCCRVRKQQRKLKQSFSPLYSEPRSVAVKAFPNNLTML